MKIRVEVLRELLKWRSYIPILIETVKKVLDENAGVYVTGSAIDDRLTVDSDIDVLVVVDKIPEKGLERAKIIDRVWAYMEKKGISWWYPFEIHLITRNELEKFAKMGRIERLA